MYCAPYLVVYPDGEKLFEHITDAVRYWAELDRGIVYDANGIEIMSDDLFALI